MAIDHAASTNLCTLPTPMFPIQPDDLQIGVPLKYDVYDASGVLLLKRGHVIETEEQMERLGTRHLLAMAPHLKRPAATVPADHSEQAKPVGIGVPASSAATIMAIYRDMEKIIDVVLDHQAQSSTFSATIEDLAEQIVNICGRDADTAIASVFMRLRLQRRYVVQHPISVATIAVLIADDYMPFHERHTLVCAALTMDLGMARLQEELFHQATPLSPAQREEIRRHPEAALTLLHSLGIQNKLWLRLIFEHHERLDGSGYPRGLTAGQLHPLSHLLIFADRYCARLSARSYRARLPLKTVLRSILADNGQHLTRAQMSTYINRLGLYPPGTFVRLHNGETAVVVRRTKDAKYPIVHTVLNVANEPVQSRIRRDTTEEKYAVVDTVSDDAVPMDRVNWWFWKEFIDG